MRTEASWRLVGGQDALARGGRLCAGWLGVGTGVVVTIRTPDQRLRVFVSSTLGELASERSVVRAAIEGLRLTPVMFELGARPHPPREVYRAYLEQSDVFIGLYWQRYGWVAPDQTVSGLEDEYDLSVGLPRLLYVKQPAPERQPGLERLVERIEAEGSGSYRLFGDPQELAELVRDDLAVLLTERFLTGAGPQAGTGQGVVDARAEESGGPRSSGGVPAARSVGTRTVLFTDVVDSVGLRQRLGEESADQLQQMHDELLTGAVEESGGTVVKGLGDGVLAVFESAADGVAAGVAAQRAVAGHARRQRELAFELRVGISAGDVVWDGGDVHGAAVAEAARLCDVARGGQVLVSELVRALARGRGGFGFEPLGELELKGLAEPVVACRVDFEPFVAAGDEAVPFPGLLLPPAGVVDYVGRAGLLEELRAAWSAADGGQSRAVLVVGEPGAGKTRTAAEVAREAFTQGALVLYGRCDEQLGVPYQPFVEALEWQTVHDPGLALGRFAGELVRLVPDLGERVDGLPAPVSSDPRVEGYRLFEAVASWVGEVSADQGLVLVVDDVHWATRPTVQLLVHVLRSLAGQPQARVLVLVAYRDTDVDRMHPWSEALGELRRLPQVSRHPVGELDGDEVLALVEQAAGHPLDEQARAAALRIHAQTEGNPFFVGEVVRHFVETGIARLEQGRWVIDDQATLDVPEGVRDVVGRRLSQLSAEANEVLRVSAAIGREVDIDVVARLVDGGIDVVLDALDEALRARLLEETGPERLRFTHELVRATLAEELTAPRRRRLHARILAVLEELRPAEVAALAHHALQAGPLGGSLQPAVGYAAAAGEQALARRATADARGWFEQALELAEEDPDTDPGLLAEARYGLGQALRSQGDPQARDTLLHAGRQALEAGRLELAAHAATAHGSLGASSEAGTVDRALVALLEDVLAQLDDPGPERATVLAKLSLELIFDPRQRDRRLHLADEARTLARAMGDPALEARVLVTTAYAVHVLDRPRSRAESARVRELSDRAGDPELRCEARLQEANTLLEHGDVEGARRTVEEAIQLAASEATPLIHWLASLLMVQFAAYDGDLAAARAQNTAALERGQQLGEPAAATIWGAIEAGLAWIDGTASAWADAAAEFADTYPDMAVWRIGHAFMLADVGRHDEARAVLTRYGLTDPDAVPDDPATWPALATLALLALKLDDAVLGAAVLRRIEPHHQRWVINAYVCLYPVEYAIATAAAATGDHDRATDSARRARRLLAERGLRSHEPLACQLLAQVLLARGHPEDHAEAHTVATDGLAAAEHMGMETRATELQRLRDRATTSTADHQPGTGTDHEEPPTVP